VPSFSLLRESWCDPRRISASGVSTWAMLGMERFRQPERVRTKKRPSIGRAAESFQTKLIASIRSVRRRGSSEHLSLNGKYVKW
jgi:hypothetical protein